jgi:hypothetical protein
VIQGPSGHAIASVTLVGPTTQVLPRLEKLSTLLRQRVKEWRERSAASPRELI